MHKPLIFCARDSATAQHAGGIQTTVLVPPGTDAGWVSGISVYPVGLTAPMHCHNCHEQITVLEGECELECEGQTLALGLHDSSLIPAGAMHAYRNTGTTPLRLLWVYNTERATRTLAANGIEVDLLSGRPINSP